VEDITDETRRAILTDAAFTNAPTLVEMKRVVCLINHSLSASRDIPELTSGLVLLIASVCKRSALLLLAVDYAALKEYIFVHCSLIVDLCTTTDATDVVFQGISDSSRAWFFLISKL
jgi:hypothetical protein